MSFFLVINTGIDDDMADITQDVNIDNSVNTIYVETISVNNTSILLHVYPEALSIIDLESKGK
jgi:hypothetical protein